MTTEEAKKRLEEIRVLAEGEVDYESAHKKEDRLHRDVLTAIAEGRCDNPAECAAIAMQSWQIEFSRWCA